jgi:hypothetical protein
MDIFGLTKDSVFSDLPFHKFNELKYSVYVVDKEWNYLFVNPFVAENLGSRGLNLVGKNMWIQFQEFVTDPSFLLLKRNTEQGLESNIVTTSPINTQKLSIKGYPLKDCYLFFSSILPKKEDVIDELRSELSRYSKVKQVEE